MSEGPVSEPVMAFWYRALNADFGIEIATSDPEYLRNKLYSLRREAKDTELDALAVCISPFDAMKVWIVKKGPRNEAP